MHSEWISSISKQNSKQKNLKLEWVSYLIGKRESRRIVGDYIYTFKDVTEKRKFTDAVVMEKRPVDVNKKSDLSETLFY